MIAATALAACGGEDNNTKPTPSAGSGSQGPGTSSWTRANAGRAPAWEDR